jgi:hypothetical protein
MLRNPDQGVQFGHMLTPGAGRLFQQLSARVLSRAQKVPARLGL